MRYQGTGVHDCEASSGVTLGTTSIDGYFKSTTTNLTAEINQGH
jgi:hypothetical protein